MTDENKPDEFGYLDQMERDEVKLDVEVKCIVLKQKFDDFEESVGRVLEMFEQYICSNQAVLKEEVTSLYENIDCKLNDLRKAVKTHKRFSSKLYRVLGEIDEGPDGEVGYARLVSEFSRMENSAKEAIKELPDLVVKLAPIKAFVEHGALPKELLNRNVPIAQAEPNEKALFSLAHSAEPAPVHLEENTSAYQAQEDLDHTLDESEKLQSDAVEVPASRRTGGYISSISIENFKGIGEKVTIPLKPITLMFGANSAGKSTVLHALLYAHEVLNNNNPDADKTEYGGEWINLGGFQNLVHNHDRSKEITIGFEYVLDDDGLPDYGPQRGNIGILPDELLYTSELFHELMTAQVSFSLMLNEELEPFISKYSVALNDKIVAKIRADQPREKAVLIKLNPDHIINQECGFNEVEDLLGLKRFTLESVGDLFMDAVNQGLEDDSPVVEDVINKVDLSAYGLDESKFKDMPVEEFSEKLFSVAKDWASFTRLELPTESALPAWGQLIPFNFESHEDWELGENVTLVYSILSSLIAGPGELVANALKEHRYIGPLRKSPPRFFRPQKTMGKGRWADGMAGWDLLYKDVLNGCEWLQRDLLNKLGLGYEFVPYEPELSKSFIGSTSHRDVAELAAMDKMFKDIVTMRDIKNHVEMEPCDVGTGVSQVIPVVAGAMSPGCNFLSVEQPELHLHPAIQCKLGDLFISQMHRYPERTFLLETHSEHLILRILRRIRETASNELEDPSLALTPEDVGVLYVDEMEDGVRITELPIDKDGEFTRKWPKGFFNERAEELF